MDNRPIGIFDSGLGGLTAFRRIIQLLPNEDIIYLGDTGRVPYGSKSRETILHYAEQDIDFLKKQNVKYIVIACGTVSCVVPYINNLSGISFTEVVKPACRSALIASKNKFIGVIGTTASIRETAYASELKHIDKSVTVLSKDCPLFVPMIESAFIQEDNKIVKAMVKYYLQYFKNSNIDTLILGCTHYPIIKKAISNFLGSEITLIDAGFECAKSVKKNLTSQNLLHSSSIREGKYKFYFSDTTNKFHEVANIFLENNRFSNYDIKKIDLTQ